MVALALYTVLIVVNTVIYFMIDAYFLYIEALHTHTYKSNHYIQEKKFAQKKISKRGYMNV